MDAAELAVWAAKHEAQIDAALERVTQRLELAAAGTMVGEAVSLEHTNCHFVFLAKSVPDVEPVALALWRCGNASEAAAAAARGSHAGVPVRDGTRGCADMDDAAQAAQLLAAQARKRGKKAGAKSPTAEADKPREHAGTAATRERDAADSGEPSATPAKKQKTTPPEAQVMTGGPSAFATPAAVTPAPVPAAPAAGVTTAAPAPSAADSERIAALEAALASTQTSLASARRDVARITRRCDLLEAAHAAEREASEKLRAAAATAEAAAAALVVAARGVAALRSADE